MTRFLSAAAAAALALLLAATPAPAAPALEARLEPQRVLFGGEQPSARLTVRTGAEPAELGVSVFPTHSEYPGLSPRANGAVLGIGCPKLSLEGPGTVGPTSCVVASPPIPCHQTRLPTQHGTYGGLAETKVEVPPNAESTLVVPLHHAHTAPWADSGYEVRFRVSGEGLPPDGEVVATPRTAPAGRTGVRLSIATSAPSGGLCEPVPDVGGGPIAISGRSDPPLAGQEVVLRYATADDPTPRELARVRAAGDGTFVVPDWRPPAPGHYEIGAAYTAQRPELADDFSELRAFRVRASEGTGGGNPPSTNPPAVNPPSAAPPVPARAAVRSRRIRFDAGGLGKVRLACPADAGSPCAGRLKIRARGRLLAARRVKIAPGARRTVHVRLRPSGRRLLRRHGKLRATVRLGAGPATQVTLRAR